jgi:pyruvate kinase
MDGTDAIMLSEETTLGRYPVEAVLMMTRIALSTEKETYFEDIRDLANILTNHEGNITDIISPSAVRIAKEARAEYIVALTATGRSARMISRYRPSQPILGFTSDAGNANKLALSFGCHPIIVPHFEEISDIMDMVRKVTVDRGFSKKGDKVVIVAGMPVGYIKETNMVLVETI